MTEFRTVETRYNAWQKPIVRPSRPLRTVDLDRLKKEALVSDIRKFLSPAARRFYAHRGIPYRRGYLFHGPPGESEPFLQNMHQLSWNSGCSAPFSGAEMAREYLFGWLH